MPAEEAVETTTSPRLTMIFAGGEMSSAIHGHSPDLVIAADSGYDHARDAGVAVDRLVGDLDSISADGLAHATSSGVSIERHPTDKDASDLELALIAALDAGSTEIHIYGGEGGSVGHHLAGVMLLADHRWVAMAVQWHIANAIVEVATSQTPITIRGAAGTRVSVVPIADATVTTSGLRWPLSHDVLPLGSSRGLHNELIDAAASVEVEHGLAFVIQEGNQ